MSLLKLWYAEEQHDNIISLGVCSDGAKIFYIVGKKCRYNGFV